MCGFDGIKRGNYFRGVPIMRTEMDVRVGKFINGRVKSEGDIVID